MTSDTAASQRALPRMLATVALGLLLFGPLVVRAMRNEPTAAGTLATHSDDRNPVQDRYGFVLTEVSEQSGINFLHTEPMLDAALDHIRPQVASMGASVSIVDFDRDGWQDLYVVNSAPGSKNRLYRNLGNGSFDDVAEQVGLANMNGPGVGACMGAIWADINNDDYEDVVVYRWGITQLFVNQAGKSFVLADNEAGLPGWANIGAATWLDYDRDGSIDLFLAGYWPDEVHLEDLETTRIMPESFEYANNGGSKWLLKNRGDGTFQDVTREVRIASTRWSLAVVAADLNADGYTDLFLSNDYGNSEVYLNRGGKQFEEVGRDCGVGYAPKSGMNASVGDVLNRGQHAIYETNISEEGVLIQGNNLWIPAAGEKFCYENMAAVMGVELGGWSFGSQFGDFNNDGHVDLYLTNGYVSAEKGTSYWYDFSQIAGGHTHIIGDAKNWPAMHGRSLSGYQTKHLWINNGTGQFYDVALSVGVTDQYDGRAVAVADLENRGQLDVVVANQRGPLLLYRNHVAPGRHWIAFECRGTTSNRSAIGTQIHLYWGNHHQMQEIVAASGYAAQSQRRVHFGLGESESVDRVVVRWPNGKEQILGQVDVDTIHPLTEPE